jgi:hypothetical protein
MRSATVTLGLTALVATALTGCGGDKPDPDYAAICVNPQTNERLDDDKCKDDHEYDGHSGGFYWFYMPSHGTYVVPPVGGHYTSTGGTYNVSSVRNGAGKPVTVQRGGVPKTGGTISTVTKGGFGKSGSTGKSSGGGGRSGG